MFFHHSSLVGLQIEEIGMGDSVTFDIEAGRDGKGPRAVNVNKQD